MSTRQDEDIRIYELPEAQELTAGMKVAVDSETDGTKSFDIGTALGEKVDMPSTEPEAGQVLTFDGSENTWANPPEGVYVINYSEVTDLRDIDIDRAKSQPTFIKIDTNEPINISIPDNMTIPIGGVGYSLPLMPGTILKLDEISPSATYGEYTGPYCLVFNTLNNRGSFPTYSIGGYGIITIRLMITVPGATPAPGPYKVFSVYGKIADGSTFAGMPVPFTEFYSNGRGVGNPSTSGNEDRNALQLKLVNHDGTTRNQCILPLDIQNHDFSSDTTPEQIQFIGWGATSNRAGYKNLITAQHTYDSTNFPIQTPQVQFLKLKMSGGTPESDQVMNVVQASMKSADGQNTEVIGGILVPTISDAGVLQAWSDSNGGHYGWKPVSEVPTSTAQDEGKVLTVDSNGTPCWDINFPVKNGYAIGGSESTVTVPNNASSTLSSSAESTLTLNVNVGPFEVPNFVVEISASSNITLTVTKTVNNTATTLKYSVAAGNTLEAGKYYQITVVGNCWTLAEFANPS